MIGTGYVGLVTGTCFAEIGLDVICIDKDHTKIKRLLAGEMPKTLADWLPDTSGVCRSLALIIYNVGHETNGHHAVNAPFCYRRSLPGCYG